MTFLNLTLAFGAAACAIPLAIHLLNRSRFQVVQWGAMHLLQPLILVNRKRLRMEQLLLLLLRMVIVALLALAMAGPVLTGARALSGNTKSSLAVLLDNSYSMEAGGVGTTHLRQATREAAQVLRRQPRGSDAATILMAGGKVAGSSASTTNLERVSAAVARTDDGLSQVDAAKSLERAAKRLRIMQNAKRDILVVSDFQARDWQGEAMQQSLRLIAAMPLRPAITLMPIGNKINDNVSIQSVVSSPAVAGVWQTIQLRTQLRQHGEVPYPSLQVVLRVDGQDIESREIDLAAGEDAQVVFSHRFQEPGSHVVEVSTQADALAADNHFALAVPVWERIPVLLVNGAPSSEPLRGETDFLEIALSPFQSAAPQSRNPDDGADQGDSGGDLLACRSLTVSRFQPDDLANQRVVVLANVPRLTTQQDQALRDFVRRGGSLLVFPGSEIDVSWYNEKFFRDEQSGTGDGLPARFHKLLSGHRQDQATANRAIRPNANAEVGVSIADDHLDHAAVALFNDGKHGRLSDGTIHTWYQLAERRGNDTSNPTAHVVAKLANGHPFLVERSFGQGWVMVAATACDDAWSNLPARPFYLPLMQRLVTHLATAGEPPRNVAAGQSIVAYLPGTAEPGAQITTPDGRRLDVTVQRRNEKWIAEFTGTEHPGVYRLQTSNGHVQHFAAMAPRTESDLTRLNRDQLNELAKQMDANLVASADEYFALDSQRRYGREIWRPLFWLMLTLIFGEVLLQQFFSKPRG